MKRSTGMAGAVIVTGGLLAAVLILSVCAVPRDARTRTAIGETFVRIHMYLKEHRDYPPSLDVLPRRDTHANEINDAWGRRLLYSADDRGVISLTSLGADGRPGGDGSDADVCQRYRTKDRAGKWIIDEEFWLIHAKIPDEHVDMFINWLAGAAARRDAAEELGWIGGAEAVSALIGALKDEDAEVRANAAASLGWLEATEAVEPLQALAQDEDARVREAAAEALKRIAGREDRSR